MTARLHRTPLQRALMHGARVASALTVTVALLLVGLRLIGAQLDVVETGSMAPAIPEGALAISMPVDPADVVVEDVITFVGPTGSLVMHRVVDVFENQGLHRYRTQGDANTAPDPGLLREAHVERRVAWSANGLGWVARAVQPPVGVLWLIGLPLLLQLAAWAVGRRTSAAALVDEPIVDDPIVDEPVVDLTDGVATPTGGIAELASVTS